MTDPLFAALPGPTGALRALLDTRLTQLGADVDLDPVLSLVVQSLADRIDWAIGGRQYRGFVMITAEFRAAYRELVGDVAGAGPDEFDRALAAFRAAEAGNTADTGPAD